MKKFICLLLVFMISMSICPTVFASEHVTVTATVNIDGVTHVYITNLLACHEEGDCYVVDGYSISRYYDTLNIPSTYNGKSILFGEGSLAGIPVKSIVFNDGIYELPKDLCRNSTMLERVRIPQSVRKIGDCAFKDCINLKEGGNLYAETIGTEAFSGCTNLKMNVVGARTIGARAFEGCKNVTGAVSYTDSEIGFVNGEVTVGGITYTLKGSEVWITGCDKNLAGDVIIPDKIFGYPVTGISEPGFYDCGEITRVVMPTTMKSIGKGAFRNCNSLREVELNSGIEAIGEQAFEYCRELKTIKIPDSVTTINDMAFRGCGLESISIGKGVTFIGDGAFWDCDSLEKIEIPDNVKVLGTDESLYPSGYFGGIRCESKLSPFYDCDKLSTVTIGKGVEKIFSSTFFDCPMLNTINVSEESANYTSLDGVLYSKDMKKLVSFPNGRRYSSYVIPENVFEIGEKALYNYTLKELYMPQTLVNIHTDNVVPDKTVIYKSIDEVPQDVNNVNLVEGVYNNIAWKAENGVLTLTGTGSLQTTVNGKYVGVPWKIDEITEIVIGEGIENIYGVFKNHVNLKKVTLPQSLKGIHDLSFYNCIALESVIIPKKVESIGVMAFAGCYNLKNVKVLSECEVEIHRGAFDIADGAVVYLPNTVKRIDRFAFTHIYSTGGDQFGANSKPQDITLVSTAGDLVEKWAQENSVKFRTPLSVKIADSYLVGGNVYEENGVVYVSGKAAFEALNMSVDCDDTRKIAVCTGDGKWMIFTNEDKTVATAKGGQEVTNPAKWINGLFMVPADALIELDIENIEITEIGEIQTPQGNELTQAANGVIRVTLNDITVSQVPELENGAFNMIDGLTQTRWSAEVTDKNDPCWAIFDLGEVHELDKIGISFYRELIRTTEFSVEVSLDGLEYTTAIARRNSPGKSEMVEYYSLGGVSARYVRLSGYGNSSPYDNIKNWFSPTEVEIYTKVEGPVIVPYVPEYDVDVDANGKVNLKNVNVTASIVSEPMNGPSNLYDGSFSTYCVLYVQDENDPQFIQIDLGKVCDVSRLALAFRFSTQRTTYFDIRVSEDGENFETIVPKQGSDRRVATYENFNINRNARYIRIYGYSNTYNYRWVSITEAEVYLNR
ncbi:MAG: leucine-rich repeat protein [Clostridia bacterium]|nr:leucine-rich repeat protein [Clostridia bacterium]